MLPFILGGIGCAGLTTFSALSVKKTNKKEIKIAQEKDKALASVIPEDKLTEKLLEKTPSTGVIIEITPRKECGLIDIKKQGIKEWNETVPTSEVKLKIKYALESGELQPSVTYSGGIATLTRRKISLFPYSSHFTDETFGSSLLLPSGYYDISGIERYRLEQPVITTRSGDDLKQHIKELHGLNLHLRGDKVFSSSYYSVKERPLYFGGDKAANKVFYKLVSTDPKVIIDKQYEHEEFNNNMTKLFSVGGVVIGGVGAAVCIAGAFGAFK